ncbi:hypothetical protein [Paenibacillus sp. NEAU-GSW1]|uniref:hypothetical protein n=1 Tax=Paenibacillus sp. NEAU-GSW1 TaxID=2682486 RepID=UPI0012E3186E|nr:hypothetical protein [Paenibacillus sp. NEAU-GSW1]MUT64492.1 hypothetical protein [Paenibacillus sp. NEAU-GSW1]
MSSATISEEEYRLIKDYCILPFIRDMVLRNNEIIKKDKHSMKPLYVRSGEALLEVIDRDIYEARRAVRQLKAQITEVRRSDEGILYQIKLRGYVSDYGLVRHVVKQEMEQRLRRYIAGMFTTSWQNN